LLHSVTATWTMVLLTITLRPRPFGLPLRNIYHYIYLSSLSSNIPIYVFFLDELPTFDPILDKSFRMW